ncbi:MAG: bifunctional diaminohydroxyphosphoribosylaminopyrimidine deaminase/5-amino-6-(5-phosphoribosylamino)uracil reductase RibD [Lachnospiraceae bacterium]|nr:bifunctional diaminohydroxyphosphoribosylaminopyrimidine deaminase/5-amino-6-(5-phosphoribosylamino)uracil reductase RibD [Lachnospiraceae bacterium]
MQRTDPDEEYMRYALSLAALGAGGTNPNPMVGAVIVKDGRILGRGYHHKCGQGHAEVEAFRDAQGKDVTGATMYVTLEPCSHYGKTPPCADKIVEKKIGRVVVAALDPNPKVAGRGIAKIRDAGIEVKTGVLADESRKLNEIFMKYIVTKRPFVIYKSAMSLDGKIATSAGESQWISCEESRLDSQKLRNRCMAIMAGSETVVQDDPRLTCRLPGGRNPIRIVVDSALRIPEDSYLVRTAGEVRTIAACTHKADPEKMKLLEDAGVEIILDEDHYEHVDLSSLMSRLGEMGIDSVLLEGGGGLAEAAFKSGIVDKVRFYIAPKIIGGTGARTPVEGAGFAALQDAVKLTDFETEKIGTDIVLTAGVLHEGGQEDAFISEEGE